MTVFVLFNSQPLILPTGNENDAGLPTFSVEADFSCEITLNGVKHKVVIPKGFITDFASFPRFLRVIDSPMDPRWLRAALVHDYLYTKYDAPDGLAQITRYEADNVFFYGEKSLGSPWHKRYPHYWGVRIGGRSHWKD